MSRRVVVDGDSDCGLHPGKGPCRTCQETTARHRRELAEQVPYWTVRRDKFGEPIEEDECET